MPNPTPQSIVEKLTRAQKAKLEFAFYGREGWRASGSSAPLSRLGLLHPGSTRLTPLGLQVRAILSREEQNDG